MLILDHQALCHVAALLDFDRGSAFEAGGDGQIILLHFSSGRANLLGFDDAVTVSSGDIVAWTGTAAFSPLAPCRASGIALGGELTRQAAAALTQPIVCSGYCNAALAQTLALLADDYGDAARSSQGIWAYSLLCFLNDARTEPSALPPLVSAALSHIQSSYDTVYGVEELAAELGISKNHLVRVFTAAVGVSPGRYLTQVRLDAAKRLLLHGGLPLDAIAGLCGFSGANYLCRVFKRETGETPRGWQTRHADEVSLLPPERENIGKVYL